MESLPALEMHWVWLAIGLILAAAEMIAPGLFLIWLSGAALITGFVTWMLPIGLPLQILLFAVLSIVSVFVARTYLRANPVTEADPGMNQRGVRLVGQVAVVTQAIVDGSGRVHHGDSEWLARGPDSEPGTRVRITGSDGVVLLVEPVDAAAP